MNSLKEGNFFGRIFSPFVFGSVFERGGQPEHLLRGRYLTPEIIFIHPNKSDSEGIFEMTNFF
jgi:hypothetical protein